jgi:hypothetical protein
MKISYDGLKKERLTTWQSTKWPGDNSITAGSSALRTGPRVRGRPAFSRGRGNGRAGGLAFLPRPPLPPWVAIIEEMRVRARSTLRKTAVLFPLLYLRNMPYDGIVGPDPTLESPHILRHPQRFSSIPPGAGRRLRAARTLDSLTAQ